jgi:hypothetical protein
MRFFRVVDIQVGEHYYVVPFPTLAGFIVLVAVVVIVRYGIRKVI